MSGFPASNGRYAALLLIISGSLFWIFSLEPIAQDQRYHLFADTRALLGVPNGMDVLTNLPFLIVGISGVRHVAAWPGGAVRNAWLALFIGVALVSLGSAYYHWLPSNDTLLWDRLPMTVGFMGLFVALTGEYLSERAAAILLFPALLLGVASVVYWYRVDDLRPYYWIQLIPLLIIPVLMVLFKNGYSDQWLLLVGLAFYLLAKITEHYDQELFDISFQSLSGHSVKHLLAACGCYCLLWMLKTRKRRPS